jgi:hypothetical protein
MSALLQAIETFPMRDYLIQRYGEEIQQGEWALMCPKCYKEKLIVNERKRTWHCWVCQRKEVVLVNGIPKPRTIDGGGGLLDLLQWLDGMTREQAIEYILATNKGYRTGALDQLAEGDLYLQALQTPRTVRPIPYPEGSAPIPLDHPYLQRRGITGDDVATFGLFQALWGRFANRLVCPVYERQELVYFQARAMWDSAPGQKYIKTLNPSREVCGIASSDVVMNLDTAATHARVGIAEGPIDCIHVGSSGVCTFGKQISPAQVAKLIRAGVRSIDLIWDADAVEDIRQAVPLLATLFDVRGVYLPWGDPGDHPRGWIDYYRDTGHRTEYSPRLAAL